MTTRNKALEWYRKKYHKLDIPIYCSKFYQPYESWPKKNVWWPKVPLKAIDEYSCIHLLCEIAPGNAGFYHLKVPSEFLKKNLKGFHILGGKIVDFYFSTDQNHLFIEERGGIVLILKSF